MSYKLSELVLVGFFFVLLAVLEIETKVSHMLGKCSVTEPYYQPFLKKFFKFEKGSYYVTQAGLEFEILLPQPPE
jgi:hypothetical protein